MRPDYSLQHIGTADLVPYIQKKLKKVLDAVPPADPVYIGIPGGRSVAYIISAITRLTTDQQGRLQLILVDERLSGVRNSTTILEAGLDQLISDRSFSYDQIITPDRLDSGRLPQMALLFLGVGEDGHVASLFPGSYPRLDAHETPPVTTITDSPKPPKERVTLTYRGMRAVSAHAETYLLFLGKSKSAALKRFLSDEDPSTLPCSFFPRTMESVIVLTDQPLDSNKEVSP